jgi:CBS domain containing-hemolysin-like protein
MGVGRRRAAAVRASAASAVLLASLTLPVAAHASFLSAEAEDALANFLALFVIFIVPIVLIVLFWLVHILPEKIAHKRNHPQFEAIRTLCLLSLVFGGLLWPLAWIWAYSKPVFHRMAYGTDTAAHADASHGTLLPSDATSLRDRLARLEALNLPPDDLATVRADVEALEAKVARSGVR